MKESCLRKGAEREGALLVMRDAGSTATTWRLGAYQAVVVLSSEYGVESMTSSA